MAFRIRTLAPLAVVGLLAVAGCASGGGDAAEEPAAETRGTEADPVQLGVVGASEPYWAVFEAAAEEEGIYVDIVDFTEYTQPNPALSEGELDINQFQHILYLADYNVSAGDDLQPIGSTAIYPLGLYSDKYDSVEDIPEGETVIVPNDTTNQARGLLVLQSAGLIELKDGGSPFSTLEDVVEDESRVKVEGLDASLIGTSLPDVAAAIINNDFLENAGLTGEDAIASDDPSDPSALPYVNIFATRAEDVDDEVLNKLVEIYQTNQDVLDGAQESASGTAEFVQTPKEELQASLEEVQEQAQSAG
ncbi:MULTISPECIES: MetQ/NlpA family ABC transporter substrate-binding protein [Microbacterium]|uniref:ABC transporter substrate-binding protein n=1 Tax=Microbacterium barkeri TaxID=33917 RepID=A0A9W6LW06_9MICO|nr:MULTISPECIES: MetQ/NlpA family ABC transporter substrate-binding protein [Microbacterium]MDI6942735.1 MetQ/NlpA family ABC transporter substrate-binding protein [Microbacterium barkeri]MDR6877578.1 D-methionine transport system substrate-binding protein [Microbacterium barkeri]WRH16137.1 methionine ABC transporter substrate-binding protein [Microbacterium sp. JZ37]GLJ60733.1 ABC transporter substrate-binding protein [Microbacterium barkeri]